MKKYLIVILLLLSAPVFSKTITGEVKKQIRSDINQVYDAETQTPIQGATVKIPSKNFTTVTDNEGSFQLGTVINSPTIMSVEKQGYKPFSMTVNSNHGEPISAAISKSTPKDIVVDTYIVHIGDNSFSQNSANAFDFCIKSCGAFYTKDFSIKNFSAQETLYLVIGSVIGVDTLQAQKLGQSHVLTAYSSPAEIFFNNNKIADIKINGDNQKISIPRSLVNFKGNNNLTIKAGRNLHKRSAVDYDDIEFTNILFEIK